VKLDKVDRFFMFFIYVHFLKFFVDWLEKYNIYAAWVYILNARGLNPDMLWPGEQK
jgi:hypothetical protein